MIVAVSRTCFAGSPRPYRVYSTSAFYRAGAGEETQREKERFAPGPCGFSRSHTSSYVRILIACSSPNNRSVRRGSSMLCRRLAKTAIESHTRAYVHVKPVVGSAGLGARRRPRACVSPLHSTFAAVLFVATSLRISLALGRTFGATDIRERRPTDANHRRRRLSPSYTDRLYGARLHGRVMSSTLLPVYASSDYPLGGVRTHLS